MNESNTTIDELAHMVAEGFNGVHREIGDLKQEMDTRFDAVEHRMDGIEKRLDGMETRLANVGQGQEEIKEAFAQAATKSEVRELDRRVTCLEKEATFA